MIAAIKKAEQLWSELVENEGRVELGQYQYHAMMAAAKAHMLAEDKKNFYG